MPRHSPTGRAITDKLRPNLKIIDLDTQQMMPAANQIIQSARDGAHRDAARLSAAQHRAWIILVSVGTTAVLLGLILSWLIGRSITRLLHSLSQTMTRLAQGDTSAYIPATRERHAIGDMARSSARASVTPRSSANNLPTRATRPPASQEIRSQAIATTIANFERSVDSVLDQVRGAAERLEVASGRLNASADAMSSEARIAEDRVMEGLSLMSQRLPAQSTNSQRRSAKLPIRHSNPPMSQPAPSPNRDGPAPPCPNSPRRQPASVKSSISSSPLPARPICWP